MTFVLLLTACAEKGEEDEEEGEDTDQRCASLVEYQFPDGTAASFDGCNDVLADATFEFDPDDPPEIRGFKLQFAQETSPGDDCWVVVTSRGICGPGYYDVGSTQSTQVEFGTLDCRGVPDAFESTYVATEGVLFLQEVSGGSLPGNFTGQRLRTQFVGSIEVDTTSGVRAIVEFDLAVYIKGEDSEESDCLRTD